ncbi:acyl-CoA dehydrogenase family protein [Bacillus sp. CECT 9360]|uniref:acyl-CoA dehydrogenase family protein n=1 Tax=Bacillus sp. CECT 9360 TaxID=2845821 RepID=UPI001E2E76CD|nr:acyl-CoA dehydrogenase family protein [Bacillus sp. CECT 9360]CAH0344038.1 Acyl-CoA dehydrogenase [Bacillus sp. CECT 9360]
MVSFMPTDEETAFAKMAREFAIKQIRPNARKSEENKLVGNDIINKAKELGFLSLELPESWDGLELPLISQVQIFESLASGDLGVVQGFGGPGETASFIRVDSENSVFADYKSAVKSGMDGTVAFLHADDPKKHHVTAEKIGEEYVLNGRSAPVRMAGKADYLLISALDTAGDDIVLFIRHDPDDHHLQKELNGDYRLGLLSSHFACYHFDHFSVKQEAVMKRGEEARKLKDDALGRISVLEAAKEVGLMSAALSYATEYTSQRKAFGQEIAKFQGVSFNIAQMAIQTQASRNLVWYAAMKLDQKEEDGLAFSLATLNTTHEAVRFVTDSAVQLLGGHGYVQEHPVEKWMRDAQAQVNALESESELLVKSGDYLLKGNERGSGNDILRAVTSSEPS